MISRRKILGGMGGVAALAAMQPVAALAGQQCSAPMGNRVCIAGLEIGPIETARQRCSNWCWAACIQTVFGLHGHSIQQEAAVQRLFGGQTCEDANRPANEYEIASTINGDWIDDNGVAFRAQSHFLTMAELSMQDANRTLNAPSAAANVGAMKIVNSLSADKPMIVGSFRESTALGHATVLTGVAYEVATTWYNGLPQDSISIKKIVVRDPWPDNQNRRELDAEELDGAVFVLGVTVYG